MKLASMHMCVIFPGYALRNLKQITTIINIFLTPVVQKVDNTIHRINHYPLDSAIGFPNTYAVDSDLPSEHRYPTFEQLGPEIYLIKQNTRTWIILLCYGLLAKVCTGIILIDL